MSEDELRGYFCRMRKYGEWGDGIMLSVAVKLYGRPIVLLSPEAEEKSAVQHIDPSTSSANDGPLIYLVFFCNHYVSIGANDERYGPGETRTVFTEQNSSISKSWV